MGESERARAFDRFWSGAHDGGSFGLGLAIVQRLVTADGGRVELREGPTGGLDAVVVLDASPVGLARTTARESSARR